MQSPYAEGIPSAFTDHGGNIAEARRLFPDAPEPWIDLSTGISPWPYPANSIPSNTWTGLPSPAATQALVAAARTAYRAQAVKYVVPCPGSDMAIGLMPRLLQAERDVAIISPTYAAHGRGWRHAGFQVRSVSEPEEIREGEIGVAVNPNNPDGRRWSSERLALAARRCTKGGGVLVVDEAFADATPAISMLQDEPLPAGVVVLRSFGKFYGLAGLRLGFVITDGSLGATVSETLGSWPVSSAALAMGTQALQDARWRAATVATLEGGARQLREILTEAGLEIVGGTSLFQLVRVPRLTQIFSRLAARGILTRPLPCLDALRFGLPADDVARARLRSALAAH